MMITAIACGGRAGLDSSALADAAIDASGGFSADANTTVVDSSSGTDGGAGGHSDALIEPEDATDRDISTISDVSDDRDLISDGTTDTDLPDVPLPPTDAKSDISDGFTPLDCLGCIRDKCRDKIQQCLSDPACLKGIQCALSSCMSGGGSPDFGCMLQCFKGDMNAVLKAVAVITCITGSCGSQCSSLLDGGLPIGFSSL